MAKIDELLQLLVKEKASDLHLCTNYRPCIRKDGDIHFLQQYEPSTSETVQTMLYEIMAPRSIAEFEKRWDTDLSYALPGYGRFRVNVFKDTEGIGGVARLIPSKIPTLEELALPDAIRNFCFLSKGLVLLTGPTGSGKSTTLAAMINLINRTRREHIITIEDPVEFVHKSRGCLINQRELNESTQSFANALRAALREDPDIVLVGEMRDLETIELAIETAETGHLVFGTLHTNTAYTAVDRIIDKFPANRQNQIRTMLADTLKGVVAQVLCKKSTGGRIAACEVLIVTPAVSANIRDGKTHQIPSAMQTGKNVGMQLFGDALLELVKKGIITSREAYIKAVDKTHLEQKLEEAGIPLDKAIKDLDYIEPAHLEDPSEENMQVARYRRALVSNPADTEALTGLAWLLATHPDDRCRRGDEALALARQAVDLTHSKDALGLAVLAAAQAETSQFKTAQQTAKEALHVAKNDHNNDMQEEIQKHLALYKRNQPVRET